MAHPIQVTTEHYFRWKYIKQQRWANFWHQLELVRQTNAASVLEVGVGTGLVAETLRKLGIETKTLDIDPALNPDLVGSVTDLPQHLTKTFDAALAAEVLEHLPWSEVPKALRELARVARTHVIVTLPYRGTIVAWSFKLPLIPWLTGLIKFPHLWKEHTFDGEHYWELGTRGRSVAAFRALSAQCGLRVVSEGHSPDDPGHYRFLFSILP